MPPEILARAEALLDAYCSRAIPGHARHKVRLGYLVRGMAITLFESRPYFQDPARWTTHSVARFRYSKTAGSWTLYRSDRVRKWRLYEALGPQGDFSAVFEEVRADPTGIFWG